MESQSTRIFGGETVLLQETDRALTPFGGMVVFLEFLNKIGFVKKVMECMPVTHRSPNSSIRDDEFMADLSQVVNQTAPEDYLNPAAFFAKSYPTRGMKELLKAVCLRLSGKGGEVSSIIRLGTQYGRHECVPRRDFSRRWSLV